MFVVLHGADGLHFVDAERLIGESVEEEDFFTRTKNNNLQVQVIKQGLDIDADESLDGEGHEVLDGLARFRLMKLVFFFSEVVFGVEGEDFFVLEEGMVDDDSFGFENADEVIGAILKAFDKRPHG